MPPIKRIFNLHQLKSFHESALDQWNSTAIILKEAADSAPSEQRLQSFIQAVIALTDIAGANSTRRDNIVKAANAVLHGLEHTENKPKKQTSRDPSVWKQTVKMIRNIVLGIVLIGVIVGAFILGQLNSQPRITSLISVRSSNRSPDVSPEQLVEQYFDAVQQGDMARVLDLYHSDTVAKNGNYIVGKATQLSQAWTNLRELTTLKVETEETARVLVNIVMKDGDQETSTFRLTTQDGQWRFVDISF